MVRRIAFSVFLAWACKRLILRFGGVGLYLRLKPLFLGMVVGFFFGVFFRLQWTISGLWARGIQFCTGERLLHYTAVRTLAFADAK